MDWLLYDAKNESFITFQVEVFAMNRKMNICIFSRGNMLSDIIIQMADNKIEYF